MEVPAFAGMTGLVRGGSGLRRNEEVTAFAAMTEGVSRHPLEGGDLVSTLVTLKTVLF